jgi:hypothetical protein
MPIYRFVVRREDDPDANVVDAFTRQGNGAPLCQSAYKEFVSSARYSDAARACLEVKDDTGDLLLSIPFRYFA